MCLSLPAIVVEEGDMIAFVDYGDGNIQPVLTNGIDVKKGDYVVVSYGMIISKISEEEFKEILSIQNELLKEISKSFSTQ
ncbi:MAG: HypC/HybG/HupF family hydrogenase formation chaperone [Sulfolobaceae archaeon]